MEDEKREVYLQERSSTAGGVQKGLERQTRLKKSADFFFHILTSFFIKFEQPVCARCSVPVGLRVCMYASSHFFLAKSICIGQHVSVYLFMFAVHAGVTWSCERARTYLCMCASVRLQHLSNCSSIRGSAL